MVQPYGQFHGALFTSGYFPTNKVPPYRIKLSRVLPRRYLWYNIYQIQRLSAIYFAFPQAPLPPFMGFLSGLAFAAGLYAILLMSLVAFCCA